MMIVIIAVDIVILEDGMEEEEEVEGERGKSRNRQYFHCYKVGRGIPYPIFISILTLLL